MHIKMCMDAVFFVHIALMVLSFRTDSRIIIGRTSD